MYEFIYRKNSEFEMTGNEYLKSLPENWNLRKIKHIATKIGSGVTPKGGSEVYSDDGIIFLRSQNVYNEGLRLDDVVKISNKIDNDMASSRVLKNDLLLNITGASIGRATIYSSDNKANVNQHVAIIRTQGEYVKRKYYLYVIQSTLIQEQIWRYQVGASREGLNFSQIRNMQFAEPMEYRELKKITNFLDIKTAQFDKIISKKEHLIEKLEEVKKSLISEVVTGKVKIVDGQLVLRDATEMKDSCIEWLDTLPSNWDEKRVKDVFDLRNERNYKSMDDVQLLTLYTTEGIRRSEDVENKTGNTVRTVHEYKKVYRDDIVVNIILAWMGAIGHSNYNGVISPAYDIYAPKSNIESKYFSYLFRLPKFSGECFRYGRGIMLMRWRTYSDEFRAIRICVPSYKEQKEMVQFIDAKVSDIENVVKKNKDQIRKLKEAKQSLISEAVTGKIDLRDWEFIEEGEML